VAFHLPEDAVKWCVDIQVQLNQCSWSNEILNATKNEKKPEPIFKGLRVRAGAHTGVAEKVRVGGVKTSRSIVAHSSIGLSAITLYYETNSDQTDSSSSPCA
jgi:class 3 adenylate cyclase